MIADRWDNINNNDTILAYSVLQCIYNFYFIRSCLLYALLVLFDKIIIMLT